MRANYTPVTEIPGDRVSKEQLERMCHRYFFAGNFSEGKDVLEVACGAGLGLGYLAKRAKRILGGDCTEPLLDLAKKTYEGSIPLVRMDAHFLPCRNRSFDVVILYEAVYYLADLDRFLREIRRVLRNKGVLLIATVNRGWSGFNPSPLSIRYFSVPELEDLLKKEGFRVEFYGAFSAVPKGATERISAGVRKIAVALHLIPKTMKGKEFLKRVFYGKLISLEEEIREDMCSYRPPVPIPSDRENHAHKVIYVVARI